MISDLRTESKKARRQHRISNGSRLLGFNKAWRFHLVLRRKLEPTIRPLGCHWVPHLTGTLTGKPWSAFMLLFQCVPEKWILIVSFQIFPWLNPSGPVHVDVMSVIFGILFLPWATEQ